MAELSVESTDWNVACSPVLASALIEAGLVDDDAVGDRVGCGFAGDRAFQRRILDQDRVEAFHAGDLTAG